MSLKYLKDFFSGNIFDINSNLKNTVILASMGRSGSTFVSNIINCDNNYRVLFEPFYREKVKMVEDFPYPLYIRENNQDKKLIKIARKILQGKIRSPWVDREKKQKFPKQRLLKDIRINLYLKWLHNNFPEIKIILLLRHPCAVIHSWLASDFGNGAGSRDSLLSQNSFIEDYGTEIKNAYLMANTDFERLAFFWCIYYFVPLQQFSKNEIHIVCYENLFLDQEDEISRLFSFINKSYSRENLNKAMRTPSSTTRKKSNVFKQQTDKVTAWQKDVAEDDIRATLEVMKIFNMHNFYCHKTSKPDLNAIHSFLRAN